MYSRKTGFQVLMPELCRGLEMFLGLLLPIVVYCTLPAYSKFRQAPDDSDVKNEIHRCRFNILLALTGAQGVAMSVCLSIHHSDKLSRALNLFRSLSGLFSLIRQKDGA